MRNFASVDLASGASAVDAAKDAGVQHFVYVSVAHPAPVMKAYIEVRSQCEALIHRSGMNATILRPWYVLGPGHRWPYLLLPVYKLMEIVTVYSRGRHAPGTGYPGTDGSSPGRGGGGARSWSSCRRGPGNPRFPGKDSSVRMNVSAGGEGLRLITTLSSLSGVEGISLASALPQSSDLLFCAIRPSSRPVDGRLEQAAVTAPARPETRPSG